MKVAGWCARTFGVAESLKTGLFSHLVPKAEHETQKLFKVFEVSQPVPRCPKVCPGVGGEQGEQGEQHEQGYRFVGFNKTISAPFC
jgi:hypothetical protein